MSDRFQLLWQILICPLVWGTVALAFHGICVWACVFVCVCVHTSHSQKGQEKPDYNQVHTTCLGCAVHVHICVSLEKKSQGYLRENFTNKLPFKTLKKKHIFYLGAFLIKRPFLSNIIWTRVTTDATASAHLVHDLANMLCWSLSSIRTGRAYDIVIFVLHNAQYSKQIFSEKMKKWIIGGPFQDQVYYLSFCWLFFSHLTTTKNPVKVCSSYSYDRNDLFLFDLRWKSLNPWRSHPDTK